MYILSIWSTVRIWIKSKQKYIVASTLFTVIVLSIVLSRLRDDTDILADSWRVFQETDITDYNGYDRLVEACSLVNKCAWEIPVEKGREVIVGDPSLGLVNLKTSLDYAVIACYAYAMLESSNQTTAYHYYMQSVVGSCIRSLGYKPDNNAEKYLEILSEHLAGSAAYAEDFLDADYSLEYNWKDPKKTSVTSEIGK